MLTVGGIMIVPDVVIVSPLEMIYSVVVSITTDTVELGTDEGKKVESDGTERVVGTEETVTVTLVCEIQYGYDDGDDSITGTLTDEGQSEIETATIAVVGMETIKLVGTESGTAVHSIITADGDEAIVIYEDDGRYDTHVIGTKTAELDYQVLGITTVAGT